MSVRADRFITDTRGRIVAMLGKFEEGQAIAAAVLQHYNSMSAADKAAIASEFDWATNGTLTVAEFVEAMTALGNMDSILGDNATPLYKMKIELS